MAYRFNSGIGGVTCDTCNILYDADLSYKEYEESYGKNDFDTCWKCMEVNKNGEVAEHGLRQRFAKSRDVIVPGVQISSSPERRRASPSRGCACLN